MKPYTEYLPLWKTTLEIKFDDEPYDDQYDASWVEHVVEEERVVVSLHPNATINCLVHESYHVVVRLIERVGASVEESEEVAAHLLEHIFEKIYNYWNKRKEG